MKKITVKDIAKELNVSLGAVSTALNDKPGISQELKEKIRKKADELGYYPNQAARSLVNKKTNKIALFLLSRDLIDKKVNEDFLLNSLLDEVRKNNKHLIVYSGDLSDSENNTYIRLCREENVIGAIFLGIRLDDPSIEEIKKNNEIPIVIFDTSIGGYINTIKTNNQYGARVALDYLYELGHRNIGIITGHNKAQVSIERLEESVKFLKEKSIFHEKMIFTGDFKLKTGYEIGIRIIESGNIPTAIFAFNDLMAIGLIRALNEKGLKVPEDVSIIGFDDTSLSSVLEITTIAHDTDLISKDIIQAILEDKRGKEIVVNPRLIERKSCAKFNV